MEAIKQAIWGDSATDKKDAEEPISDDTGAGDATEPYDKGNVEEGKKEVAEEPLSGETGKGTASEPYDTGNLEDENKTTEAVSSSTNERPSEAGVTKSDLSAKEADLATKDAPRTSEKPPFSSPVPNTVRGDTSYGNPSNAQGSIPGLSTVPDPESTQKPTAEHQGSQQPTEVPDSTGHEGTEGKEDDKQPLSYEPPKEGTGQEYVKSSGLAADGRVFDASKPGAGKEADRLLEQKGIHRSEKGLSSDPDEADDGKSSPSGGRKVSIATKLKEKLHIGKHGKD